MDFVYDTSFAGAVIILDERSQKVDKLRTKTSAENVNIFVPQLFWYELTNVFNKLIRHKRYTYNEVIDFYPLLVAIRLTTDFETGVNYSKKLLRLSNTYGLSCYDAAYLELAERKKAVLCTLDDKLKHIANKHGIKTL
jgi:predicted nucleic acid-binding protein